MQSMASNDKVEVGVRVGMISPQHIPQKPSLIVLKGKMQGDVFEANEILMKCPSKYNDGKPKV